MTLGEISQKIAGELALRLQQYDDELFRSRGSYQSAMLTGDDLRVERLSAERAGFIEAGDIVNKVLEDIVRNQIMSMNLEFLVSNHD